ncbi:Vms1/Ankzf1 family peptidyl-tRNA hydrolase [Micromonospora sp. SH-82]|uniref:baeRF2 domain-containing protein n=1 Tax=Micromonospora sp. SH-82 TaxID=3132938 RepID=UPI003EB9691E
MELAFLRPLFAEPGPWASVYLDASRTGENAGHEVDLRWRALREQLTAEGADQATLDALDTTLRQPPFLAGRHGLAMFARDGEVVLVEPLAAPPPVDVAAYGPLPHAMPLVAQRGRQVPYVQVLADRTGADLSGQCVGGTPREQTVDGGEQWPLRKVNAGGWSHSRFQQAAQESWRRNAGDVAAAAADLAETVDAEAIVVGGDVRAAQQVVEQLPVRWQERTVRTDLGSRGPGADPAGLDEVTDTAVTEVAERHTRAVVDRFRAQRADDGASAGLSAVVDVLRRGQADTVLMADVPDSTERLWVSPDDPMALAVEAAELRAAGVQDPVEVRADAALLRAVVGTGTQLVLVDREQVPLRDDIGAVLRYADASTPTA